MSTNIFAGNLPFSVSDSSLRELFAQHGTVTSAKVVLDRDTGRSRGFGFVEMATDDDAQQAISSLNGSNVDGRQINVNIARPRR